MATLLNFVTIRNPQTPSPREIATGFIRYEGAIGAELLERIAAAQQRGVSPEEIRGLVRDFRGGDRFLRTEEDLARRLPAIADFAEWLSFNATRLSWERLDQRLGGSPVDMGDDDRRLLWENLVAYVYGGGVSEVRESLIWALRAVHVIGWSREDRDDDALATRLAQATVLVPAEAHFRLEQQAAVNEVVGQPAEDEERVRAQERLDLLERAHQAVEYALQDALEKARSAPVSPPRQPRVADGCLIPPEEEDAQPNDQDVRTPAQARLDDAVMERLDADTSALLGTLGLSSGIRLTQALQVLEQEGRRVGSHLWESAQPSRRVVQAGGALWTRAALQASPETGARRAEPAVATRGNVDYSRFFGTHQRDDDAIDEVDADRPGRCRVRPLGIGDFRRVEQRLCCYEPGEVAHIENVLKGETKQRTTRRLLSTERLVATVTEEETSEERDTQTTDRFELERETSKVVESDLSFELGVNIAAQYGPVKLTADTRFATSTSRSESDQQASRFARQVTDRALERVTRTVREERATRTVEEFEETNLHRLQARDDHVVGTYRWVDKVYEAKIVNYGKRLMFEFLVPEPAAFHLHALATSTAEHTGEADKPVDPRSEETWTVFNRPPLHSFADISATNYGVWAAAYEATVEPPPTRTLTLGKAYHREGMDHTVQFADSKNDFKLTEGYEASWFFATFGLHSETHSGGANWMTLFVGRQSTFRQSGGTFSGFLAGEDDVVPVLLMGRTRFYAVNLEVDALRSPRLYEQWQLKTFNAILSAYQNKLAEYQTALAAAQAEVGVQIRGTNPLRNREIEQVELEKSCIRLLTGCARLPSEAMQENGECDYPEFDCCTAIRDGDVVQFFEQLFEWRLMTYQFYPYFWGRHCNWQKIYQLDDVDPLFLNFLQAGFARVVVPVREGYDAAAMRYLADGALWNGGAAPGVDDPMYVAIGNELKEPVGEVDPDVTPWDIRVPTSLTVLQCDSGCVEGTGLPCPCEEERGDGEDEGPRDDQAGDDEDQ